MRLLFQRGTDISELLSTEDGRALSRDGSIIVADSMGSFVRVASAEIVSRVSAFPLLMP